MLLYSYTLCAIYTASASACVPLPTAAGRLLGNCLATTLPNALPGGNFLAAWRAASLPNGVVTAPHSGGRRGKYPAGWRSTRQGLRRPTAWRGQRRGNILATRRGKYPACGEKERNRRPGLSLSVYYTIAYILLRLGILVSAISVTSKHIR